MKTILEDNREKLLKRENEFKGRNKYRNLKQTEQTSKIYVKQKGGLICNMQQDNQIFLKRKHQTNMVRFFK